MLIAGENGLPEREDDEFLAELFLGGFSDLTDALFRDAQFVRDSDSFPEAAPSGHKKTHFRAEVGLA